MREKTTGKTILFDLDGTLTDPKVGITRAVNYVLKAHGIEEKDLDRLCPFIGPPLSDSFQEFYGFSKEEASAAIPIFHEYFSERGMYENQVYEGIPQMLGALKEAGYCLAVATSKPEYFAVKILEHFGLLAYFDLVGGADMEETRVKKGDVIRYTLDRLREEGWEAKAPVMVGDRRHDVEGARENGMACVGVLYGYGGREELEMAGAAQIVNSVEELRELLLR